MDSSVSGKDEIWFLRVCHHVPHQLYGDGCDCLMKDAKNVHDDPWSDRPSVVNEDLVRAVEEKIRVNRRFTITSLSLHFPQISPSLLHEIVSDKPKFWKLCARWVPKMLTEKHRLKPQATIK